MAYNILEFHAVNIFSKRKIFNATHYIEHIRELILILRPKSRQYRFVIHAHNARPHIAEYFKYFVTQFLSKSPHILHTLRIGIIILLFIRIYEALFKDKFLSFRRNISFRNSHSFKGIS
jgi:hypothetical protein